MEIITSLSRMRKWSAEQRAAGRRLGLVPTMGYFHAGHLALMRHAASVADRVVVSLFVNPIQFGPGEDLARYPRDLARDRELAEQAGVDILFVPDPEEMYPSPPLTRVTVAGLTAGLCGRSRPGHFDGVRTVVAKLFNNVRPDLAVFGRKDLQQLTVIRRMAADLDFGIEILAHPIVRENDGLAMSSRNSYLSPAERITARCLFQALERSRAQVAAGVRSAAAVRRATEIFLNEHENTAVEYISIVAAETLEEQDEVGPDSILALAVRVGGTRLIDNVFLARETG